MRIAKFGVRAKFLLVRIAIAAALTIAVIFVVRFQFGSRADRQIAGELRQCEDRSLAMQSQTDAMRAQIATILATTPEIQVALSTGRNPDPTILPNMVARYAGANLIVVADVAGEIVTAEPSTSISSIEPLIRQIADSSASQGRDGFWFIDGKLYRIHRQQIRGVQAGSRGLGLVVIGTEIGPRLTAELSAMCSCDIAFVYRDSIVTSSLGAEKQNSLSGQLAIVRSSAGGVSLTLANEPYRASLVQLASGQQSPQLVTLKSFEATRRLQTEFTRLLVILALVAMVVGFFLVLRVSDTFSKPLGNLVGAVRALEKGDFSYPLKIQPGNELAEVTQSFDQMRSTLQDTQQQLLKNERLATIGRMASSISHDLRHQFTTILANSEFLSEPTLPPEQRHAFYEEIRSAVDQLNDLVESLLEFSRGRESPRLVMVNVEDIVERAVRTVQARQDFHAVEIRASCATPVECLLDPSKIERALNNLLINSCEACESEGGAPAGSGKVDIAVTSSASIIEIRVTDNGPGVPEDVRASLFQPFVSHGKTNGTGLGLAIVQKVCRDHGGDAILESSEPGRTVFKLAIPLSRQAHPTN